MMNYTKTPIRMEKPSDCPGTGGGFFVCPVGELRVTHLAHLQNETNQLPVDIALALLPLAPCDPGDSRRGCELQFFEHSQIVPSGHRRVKG